MAQATTKSDDRPDNTPSYTLVVLSYVFRLQAFLSLSLVASRLGSISHETDPGEIS